MRNNISSFRFTILCFLAALVGCSPKEQLNPQSAQPVYSIASRKFAPERVYNRMSWALLPGPLSQANPAMSGARISQTEQVNLKHVTAETAANRLGKLFGYRVYCAASIANRRVSIKDHGDLDTLAEALAREAVIRVVVDHDNKELRLFALEIDVAQ